MSVLKNNLQSISLIQGDKKKPISFSLLSIAPDARLHVLMLALLAALLATPATFAV
jgi:hypothetical protein